MSVKRTKADGFMLRFPNGLRDRVKAAAERNGRSMNEEIIRLLERTYPEPWPLDVRLRDLALLMSAFTKVRGHEKAIDSITDEILETAEAIASGKVPEIPEDVQKAVRGTIEDWHLSRAKSEQDRYEAFDYPSGDLDKDEEG